MPLQWDPLVIPCSEPSHDTTLWFILIKHSRPSRPGRNALGLRLLVLVFVANVKVPLPCWYSVRAPQVPSVVRSAALFLFSVYLGCPSLAWDSVKCSTSFPTSGAVQTLFQETFPGEFRPGAELFGKMGLWARFCLSVSQFHCWQFCITQEILREGELFVWETNFHGFSAWSHVLRY